MTAIVVVWFIGCATGAYFADSFCKCLDDLEVAELAALVALWPLFVIAIIVFGAGAGFYGWWTLTKKAYLWSKRVFGQLMS